MTLASKQLSLTINDKAIGPIAVPETMMMQDFLHEYLDLTGSRMGCGQGICHACTVIVEKDDSSLHEMRTCITGAHWFGGKKVRTVEGHAKRDASGRDHRIVASPAGFHRAFLVPVRLLHAGFRDRRDRPHGPAQAQAGPPRGS